MVAGFGDEVVAELVARFPDSSVTAVRRIGAREAVFSEWPGWVPGWLVSALGDRGVGRLFAHQVQAADAVFGGRDCVVATGTSSGKSLCYQLPIAARLAADPLACALYVAPTKALGNDQLDSFASLVAACEQLGGVLPAVYDGDTPVEARRLVRDRSRFVVTNPDMLHAGVLGQHERWGRLLRNLRFVVVDECHVYRGVFGAHVSLVLRRLLRLCRFYGANPTVVCASATSRDPGAHARRLVGRDFVVVGVDSSPQGERTVVLWEPGFLPEVAGDDEGGEVLVAGTRVRRAASSESALVMAFLVFLGLRTLTFVRSRRAAEVVALRAQEELALLGRADFAGRVAAYRAGFTPEERRELERRLDDGFLLGVASTSALELGVDVGGLDAVVTAGVPGSVASLWQQAGRAGRRGQSSVVVLVARDEPMDAFLVHHPEALLDRPLEEFVFDPANPFVLRDHVVCAAVERPLSMADVEELGAGVVVDELVDAGVLRRRGEVVFVAPRVGGVVVDPREYHRRVSVRGGSGSVVSIVDVADGRVVGEVDSVRAFSQVHPGAVYVHQGVSFVVEDLDVDSSVALVRREDPWFSTAALSETDIALVGAPGEGDVCELAAGVFVARVGVLVRNRVVGYMVRNSRGEVVDRVPLDFVPQEFETRGVAFTLDPLVLEGCGLPASRWPGALHAAEHALIGLLPLLATCDRLDIGGVSTALHADTGLPSVFVYDGHPGGAGFADAGFARFGQWVEMTLERVRGCECESGCPSCIQSPKCGNGNEPLDKQGAVAVLSVLDVGCRVVGKQ
ncbi:DEAD/DEAH box helicase [Corynebacterium aquilae]|uniref:DEAD/DEAH box helicase n=1 Tax=Corynebacterium aquilae TaxID=203263 RepID=UPI00095194B7|nr:DEAD/DEAH box helicase [Corynebacterium aquilae]